MLSRSQSVRHLNFPSNVDSKQSWQHFLWFMNSKHEPVVSVLVLANLSKLPVFVSQHQPWYFHICIVALQTSNSQINLRLVDVSAVLMLLMWKMDWCNLLSLVFAIYRSLMSHYRMSWWSCRAVSRLALWLQSLTWFCSSHIKLSWRDRWCFGGKTMSSFKRPSLERFLNKNLNWMEIFFPFQFIDDVWEYYLFWWD